MKIPAYLSMRIFSYVRVGIRVCNYPCMHISVCVYSVHTPLVGQVECLVWLGSLPRMLPPPPFFGGSGKSQGFPGCGASSGSIGL